MTEGIPPPRCVFRSARKRTYHSLSLLRFAPSTAMNYSMIATGNHNDLDPLRGAPLLTQGEPCPVLHCFPFKVPLYHPTEERASPLPTVGAVNSNKFRSIFENSLRKTLDKFSRIVYYNQAYNKAFHMEKSRSWPSAHDWKSCIPQKGIEGSNPSFSAMIKTSRASRGFYFFLTMRKREENHCYSS